MRNAVETMWNEWAMAKFWVLSHNLREASEENTKLLLVGSQTPDLRKTGVPGERDDRRLPK